MNQKQFDLSFKKKKKGERKNKTGLKQGLEKKTRKNWSVTRILIEIGGMGRTFNYE